MYVANPRGVSPIHGFAAETDLQMSPSNTTYVLGMSNAAIQARRRANILSPRRPTTTTTSTRINTLRPPSGPAYAWTPCPTYYPNLLSSSRLI